MNMTFLADKDTLTISIAGRIDASNSAEVEKQIFDIKNAHSEKHLALDAEELEYISSAGLRVILKLRKVAPKLAVINVSPAVYDIFHTTGFTDMLTVEKAYRKLSLDGCTYIANGANGAVYRYDDETILKVYFSENALPEIKQERENARKALILGINTAIPYDIVRIGDHYGSVTELLNTVNLTEMIRKNPDDLETAVGYFVDMINSVHSIEAEDDTVPDMKEIALGWVDCVAEHLPEAQVAKLRALIAAVPKQNTMLHGDYHSNNVMVQNGEPLIIDLDTLCKGHPIFEFAAIYNAYVGFSELDHEESMKFFGFPRTVGIRFWNLSLRKYLGTEDEAQFHSFAEKGMVLGYTKMLRRALRRPNEAASPAIIALCQRRLAELLERVDSLLF